MEKQIFRSQQVESQQRVLERWGLLFRESSGLKVHLFLLTELQELQIYQCLQGKNRHFNH